MSITKKFKLVGDQWSGRDAIVEATHVENNRWSFKDGSIWYFDVPGFEVEDVVDPIHQPIITLPGQITRRELFAAMAMQGIVFQVHGSAQSRLDLTDDLAPTVSKIVALESTSFADALIAELDKPKEVSG